MLRLILRNLWKQRLLLTTNHSQQHRTVITVRSMNLDDLHLITDGTAENDIHHSSERPVHFSPNNGIFHPEFALVAEYQNKVVGTLLSLKWAESIYYGASLRVAQRFRGKEYAVARALRTHMSNALIPHGGIVCADATVKVAKTNEKLGFVTKFEFLHLLKDHASPQHTTWEGSDFNIKKVSDDTESIIDQILRYDDQCFITTGWEPRHNFLRSFLSLNVVDTWVVTDDTGQLQGYGCLRPVNRPNHYFVGPLYADRPQLAASLLGAMTEDIVGSTLHMRAWGQPSIEEILQTCGFLRDEVCYVRQHYYFHKDAEEPRYTARVFGCTSAFCPF